MILTKKQLKQIIKEELQGVLNENAYIHALETWKEKFRTEPESWSSEREQYLDMLQNEGPDEEWWLLLGEDRSMFASILQHLLRNDDDKGLKKIAISIGEHFRDEKGLSNDEGPNFLEVYLEFEPRWWGSVKNKILKMLYEGYIKGMQSYFPPSGGAEPNEMHSPMWAWENVLKDLVDFYYGGIPYEKRLKETGELISLTNSLVHCDATTWPPPKRDFEDYRKMIDGGWNSVNWCEELYDGEF